MNEKIIPLREHEAAARLCDELAERYDALVETAEPWDVATAAQRADACRECAALIRGQK